jgi:hypothetical protein
MLLGRMIHPLTHRPVGLAASSPLGPGQLGTLIACAISAVRRANLAADAATDNRAELADLPFARRLGGCAAVSRARGSKVPGTA